MKNVMLANVNFLTHEIKNSLDVLKNNNQSPSPEMEEALNIIEHQLDLLCDYYRQVAEEF